MGHGNAIWPRLVLPTLGAVCLGIWSVIALEAAGLISLERCEGAACASTAVVGMAQKHF